MSRNPIYNHDSASYLPAMADSRLLSRQDIIAATGLSTDEMTVWLRAGLFRNALEHQARKHFRFETRQIEVARVLQAVRAAGLGMEALAQISDDLQRAIELWDEAQPPAHLAREIWIALETDLPIGTVLGQDDASVRPADMTAVMRAFETFRSRSIDLFRVGFILHQRAGFLYAGRNAQSAWVLRAETRDAAGAAVLPHAIVSAFAVVIDCARVFGPSKANEA